MDVPQSDQILPLLDGFITGDAISDHHGVSCQPAMREATQEKYILKAISVPASAQKLEALLLAGAFSDKQTALAYFKDLSEGIVEEAVLLQRLSRLEGFTPYENWQIVPKENEEGFDVYLLGAYRPTLERYLSRSPMTHLGAVNLGLDLCAALAVCRRSGHLYVDLKPSNIFICEDHEYRIGDLGFIPLASLKYASLPDKYHSTYTAPEVTDAYSALNDTLDIYAAGLILYQVYNNGMLPFEGSAPSEPLPPPEYADYEMAAIILKACDPDPQNRWQDPTQMGQALVAYLQKNTVNDTPIVPPAVPIEEESAPEEMTEEVISEEPTTEEIISEVDQALESVGVDPELDVAEVTEEETCEEAEPAEETTEAEPEAPAEDVPDEEASAEETPAEETAAEETAAEETEDAPAQDEEITAEVSQMLAQADELIAHETPEPVVAPAPIDVPIPPRIVLPPDDEPEAPVEEPSDNEEGAEVPAEDVPAEPAEEEAEPEVVVEDEEEYDEEYDEAEEKPRRGRGLIAALVCFIIAAALFLGGYVFYRYYYQQTIENITLSGYEDKLTVQLTTDIDDELLTVVCTDSYGNTKRQTVTNGEAVFTGLSPDTRYKVQVEIYDFHQLIGVTSGIHITQEQTSIVNFSAVTGTESGSVILNFTVQGPESNEWKVSYFAEGEEEKSVIFAGRMVTITGLTIGKHYTFQLEPTSELYIVGTDTVEFTVSKLIYAENLTILGFSNNALTAVWNTPEGETVDSWTVRCYNDAGYDKTITVTEPTAVFESLDISAAYTVEVCASGMSLGSRAFVSANSITIKDLAADSSDPTRLKLSWGFEGTAPEGGWLVLYTVTGIAEQQVMQCNEPYAEFAPMIPGATYTFSIQAAGGNTVFGGTLSHTAPAAKSFSGYDISAEYIKFAMCRTPDKENWVKKDVKKKDYTTEFTVGESASFAVTLEHEYSTSSDKIITVFLIRDSDGNIVSSNFTSSTWTDMWRKGFGRMTIPTMPTEAGSYTVEIYFNGQYVTTQSFTIV